MKTKTVMKKSLALLLTVMMVLSSVVTSAFVFTAAAEEPAGGDEAELVKADGEVITTGTFLEVIAEANKSASPDGMTVKLLKDFELTEQVTIPAKVAVVDGTKPDGGNYTVYMSQSIEQKDITTYDGQEKINHNGIAYFLRVGTVIFRHVNLNGQPMNYTGETPVSFGVLFNATTAPSGHKESGAFYFNCGSNTLTLDGCRMEGFYSNVNGTCFYMSAALAEAESGNGVVLKDTVITGNKSLGATAGSRGTVFRTRTGGACGTEIYLQGNTIVYGNFDKDGAPGNIYVTTQGKVITKDSAGNIISTSYPTAEASACVFVDAGFTGLVGLNNFYGLDTASLEPHRGCIKFPANYDDSKSLLFCYAKFGEVMQYRRLKPGTDSYGTADEEVEVAGIFYRAAYNAGGTTAWTATSSMTTAIAAMTKEATQPRDENGAAIVNPTLDQQRAAADKSLILVFQNMKFADVGTTSKDNGGGFYTIDGNGYTLTKNTSSIPMFRLNYNTTSDYSYVKFKNVILDAGYTVKDDNEDGILEFNKRFEGNWGTLIHIRGAKATVDISNATLKNAVSIGSMKQDNIASTTPPDKPNSFSQGAAVFLHDGANAYLDSITVTNCYNTGKGVISADKDYAKIFISGKCSFSNNYLMNIINPICVKTTQKAGADTTDTTDDKYQYEYTCDFKKSDASDIYVANANQLYIDGSFQGTVIPYNPALSGRNVQFANLKEGDTLNAGLNFTNTKETACVAQVTNEAVDGYYPVIWVNPTMEDVTFTLKNINGSREVATFVRNLATGDALPAIGCAWKNAATEETVTTHTAGASYVSDWTGVETVNAISINDTATTVVAGDFATLIANANTNDRIELLCNIDSVAEISIKKAITIDGNGHKITMTTTNEGNMFNVSNLASGLTFADIELNGGGVTAGVWEEPIASVNKRLVCLNGSDAVKPTVTFEDCTLKGQRIYSDNHVVGSVINPDNAYVYFKGTTVITDNLSMGVTSKTDTTYNNDNGTSAIRCNNAGLVAFEGHVTIKENYAMKYENGEYLKHADKNLVSGGGTNSDGYKRVLITGDLEDGSEIWFMLEAGYMVGINPETKRPYTGINNAIKTSGGSKIISYIVSTPDAVDGDKSINTANDSTLAVKYYQAFTEDGTKTPIVTPSAVGVFGEGIISDDEFVMNVTVGAVKADPETTFYSIKVGNQPETIGSLADLKTQPYKSVTTEKNGYTIIQPVRLPMSHLTDVIAIRIYDNNNETIYSTNTSVKNYAQLLIGKNDAELRSYGVTEGKEEAMRMALKALLNFGGYSQTYFGYNTDKLANEGIDKADNYVVNHKFSFVDSNVKPKRSTGGNVNVTISDISLILDSQISLRMYLTFKSGKTASNFSFSVEGAPYEVITVGDESYIEVKHIKTAELGDYVNLSITETGGDTVTFSCSPMTYVDIVLNRDVELPNKTDLENACKALYYYYSFVGQYFEFPDATGATITPVE